MTPAEPPSDEAPFRWQALFQQSADPLFVLSRRRRLLFVNRAWETLTGLKLAEVKGQPCRRKPRGILSEPIEVALGALAPPPEVVAGQVSQVRRHLSGLPVELRAWRVTFFPLLAKEGLLGILGRIEILKRPPSAPRQPLPERILHLRDQAAGQFRADKWIGDGPAMQRLRTQIGLAALTHLPALIVGPPGAGKHWVARAIHEQSPARQQYFACLDCARIPGDLIADLLFEADLEKRGNVATVYLKGPGQLAREHQAQLAQALASEEGVERLPRVLLGIRADAGDESQTGGLLHELYYLASPLVLTVPPMRERLADLPHWVEQLLPRAAAAAEKEVQAISAEALTHLSVHAWPGNLTELYQVLASGCGHCKANQLEAGDLPFYLRGQPMPAEKAFPLDKILEEVEKRLLTLALRLAKNNKSRAAELLSIWRPRLLRRMEALGIGNGEEGAPP